MKPPVILRAEFHDRERYARFLGAGLRIVYHKLLNKVGEYGDDEAKRALKFIDNMLISSNAQHDLSKKPCIDSSLPILNETLKAGCLVRLRSGGPVMTVTKVTKANEVTCVWFDCDVLKDGVFTGDGLVDFYPSTS